MAGNEELAEAMLRLADVLEREGRDRERRRADAEARRRREDPVITAEVIAVRSPLRKLTDTTGFIKTVLRVAPREGAFETRIPGHFWASDTAGVHADLACPCGEQLRLVIGEIAVCGECGRGYVFDGAAVRVDFPRSAP